MTRYLLVTQVKELHQLVLEHAGGSDGIRDEGALESAVAQPMMMFGGEELYATLCEKAAALGFSLIMNHPFVDGNKRVGIEAMEVFLRANGHRINAPVDDAEAMILAVAAGRAGREALTAWLKGHVMETE